MGQPKQAPRPDLIEAAERCRQMGGSWLECVALTGLSKHILRCALEPGFRERKLAADRARQAAKPKKRPQVRETAAAQPRVARRLGRIYPLTIRQAAELRSRGWGWQSVATRLGVGYHSLRSAMEPEYKAKRTAAKRNWRNEPPRDYSAPGPSAAKVEPPASRVPQSVLFERERAYASYGGFAQLLGEPPVGRSALDRRQR